MLTITATYSISVLSILARDPGRFVLTADLAKKSGVPHFYLAKVLQGLARAQILESRKGIHGGFRLARDPRAITLLHIVNAIENPGNLIRCPFGKKECADSCSCVLREKWAWITGEYLELMKWTTLGDLV